jgi:hypothetical protein
LGPAAMATDAINKTAANILRTCFIINPPLSWLMLFGKGIVPPACHDPIASFLIIFTNAADATSN